MSQNFDNVTQQVNDTIGRVLAHTINMMPTGPEKVNIGVSVAFNAVTTTAAILMEGFNPREGRFPTNDHCLLALFLIYEGASIMSDANARCEFSPARLWDALQDFEKFTGRNGEHLLNKNLLAMVKEKTAIDPTKFGINGKFLQ